MLNAMPTSWVKGQLHSAISDDQLEHLGEHTSWIRCHGGTGSAPVNVQLWPQPTQCASLELHSNVYPACFKHATRHNDGEKLPSSLRGGLHVLM